MAQTTEIKVSKREKIGGYRPRRLLKSGVIPAVLYGGKRETIPLNLNRIHLEREVGPIYENQILSLWLEGEEQGKAHPVIIKEIQINHLNGSIIHIDFQEIVLHEKLVATTRIMDVGESIGVSRDGGILQQVLRDLEIKCLPAQLPEKIEVDVSALEIGDSIQVKGLKIPEGVEVMTDPGAIVFTVTAPKAEEVAAPAEEVAAAPEVIGEEKEKEEEGAPQKEEAPAEKGKEKEKEKEKGKEEGERKK